MGAHSQRLFERVVRAVASEKGVDPTALQPLFEVVDPNALDALFRRSDDGTAATVGSVRFEYAGKVVVVDSDASVRVRDARSSSGDTDESSRGADNDVERVGSE